MKPQKNKKEVRYQGVEQGPIRPPSEAQSLLIRVTRNCPWNHCTFCPVYKGDRFSIRPKDHVKQDIDTLGKFAGELRALWEKEGHIARRHIDNLSKTVDASEMNALYAVVNWMSGGMKSIFLQDANSLIIRPGDLIDILNHMRGAFPWVERITSYARSHTIAKISDDDMREMARAGLNRIHIGLESGSDTVLKMVKKGVTKEIHIKAGKKVKTAGIELSEYVMPGLGGQALSHDHARETADALNQINPDFIRLRSLAIPKQVPLFQLYDSGEFEKCTDLMMCREILLFIESLNGITSTLASDHILNLFQDVEGTFPTDKPSMMTILKAFIDMAPHDRMLYQVGRRLGMFASLKDLDNGMNREKVEAICRDMGITPANADAMIDEMMRRFI